MYGGVQELKPPTPLKAFTICVVSSPPEGVSVGPHCVLVGGVQGCGVVSPSGNVAGNPALLQSIARLELRIFDHGVCAASRDGHGSNRRIIFIFLILEPWRIYSWFTTLPPSTALPPRVKLGIGSPLAFSLNRAINPARPEVPPEVQLELSDAVE